jgi:hypothetical protein
MRKYGKIDSNQPEIVVGLRAIGCSVLILKDLGEGKPDLAVARDGRTVLMEVKNPKRRGWDHKANQAQRDFRDDWKGELYVVYSQEEAIAIMLGPTPFERGLLGDTQ